MSGSLMEDLKTYNIEIVVASGGFCIVRIIVLVDLCFLKFSRIFQIPQDFRLQL